jgi:hypothetical protein
MKIVTILTVYMEKWKEEGNYELGKAESGLSV